MGRPLGVLLALLCALPALAAPVDEGLPPAPRDVDRATPLASVQGFLNAAHHNHYVTAAYYLDLGGFAPAEQVVQGPRLARRLRFVLDRQLWLDLAALGRQVPSDAAGLGVVELGVIPLDHSQVPIRLVRRSGSGTDSEKRDWVFSRDTVHAVDRLYEVYGPPLGERLPEVLFARPLKGLELWQWIGLLGLLLLSGLIAYGLERLFLAVAARITRLTPYQWDDQLVASARGPLRFAIGSALLAGGATELLLPPNVQSGLGIFCRSLVVIATAWTLLRFLSFVAGIMEAAVSSGAGRAGNSANARSVRTQMAVLEKVLRAVIYVVAAAVLLMQFSVVRSVGVSLLASAGVAGVVVGLAAQKSIGMLLAGIQLSITQPVRIGDLVVVEGESGTIEEINLTYAVIRVWDLRRLIIPITYFLDKPFQNWSKGPAGLLGTVTLQVDYTADVDSFRAELARVLREEGKSLWDGRIGSLKVTESSERTQTFRVLVSAASSDDNWDLRCLVREKLILFLKRHPEWLPTQRTQSLAHAAPSPSDSAGSSPAIPPPTNVKTP